MIRTDADLIEAFPDMPVDTALTLLDEADQAAWELLAAQGCDLAQGSYLSSAVPPAELVRWCRDRPIQAA